YSGGVIVPGIMISAEALFEKAARLSRVEIRRPEKVVGKTTSASIQSGLYFGYLSLVDGVIDRIVKETGGKPRVIATGGLAELFAWERRSEAMVGRGTGRAIEAPPAAIALGAFAQRLGEIASQRRELAEALESARRSLSRLAESERDPVSVEESLVRLDKKLA